MLVTELHPAQIPGLYQRFAEVIGESHWKRRVAQIKQEIRGNRFLHEHLEQENAIAFQLEHLRTLFERFGGIPPHELNNRDSYPAMSFAGQVLSIIDSSSNDLAEQFRRRIHGALKNPDDMRALRLELTAATHFARRGRAISWPEMTGAGSFDMYIDDLGPQGLEIECKSISEDKGRKIHKREVLDFYGLLWPHLQPTRRMLRTGRSVVLTVPGRLPTAYNARQELAKQLATHIFSERSAVLPDRSEIRVREFDISRLPNIPSGSSSPYEIRVALDDVTGTRNRQTMVIGTSGGGVLALAVQSAADDFMLHAVFSTLSDSARRQLSGTRGGMFFAGFHGLDGAQLLSVADQDQDPSQPPTALRVAVSHFLSSHDRDHVVGVGFVSESALSPVRAGLVESGGTAYYFPKRESPYWSEDFSGLFTWSRQR